MFDAEKLLQLGLFNQVVPVWQVFFFIVVLIPFLLLNRMKICLFLLYLFTFYLGFVVQWGDYLASAGAMLPFMLYAFSGIFVSVVFVLLAFKDEGFRISQLWKKNGTTLQEFDAHGGVQH
jgi:hypothetical protein